MKIKMRSFHTLATAFLFLCSFHQTAAQSCPGIVKDVVSTGPGATGTKDQWTVPAGGPFKVKITAKGAQGGQSNFQGGGGAGATIIGEFVVQSGDVLEAIAGAQGGYPGGGGGGSGVRQNRSSVYTNLIIAGGGGGGGGSHTGSAGQATSNGTAGGSTANATGGAGGVNGTDGAAGSAAGGGGAVGSSSSSGFGASGSGTGGGGFSAGGSGTTRDGIANQGGGGGGYSGGGGGAYAISVVFDNGVGGGAGSYNTGTNQINTTGGNLGNGEVIIECLGAICPSGNILYVNAAAASGGNGGSWATAFSSLQDALSITATCTSVNQIWVAKGTYYPTVDILGDASPAEVRRKTFALKNNLAIYGGFSGNGTETQLSERDWANNKTILSGDIDRNNTLDIGNAYNVVLCFGLNSSAILDGVTVTAGFGGNNAGGGAGIANNGASPRIINCTIEGNAVISFRGGGMYNFSSSPYISNCFFNNNTGGAMYNITDASPTINNTVFSGNVYQAGGAIFCWQSSVTATGCTFMGNTSSGEGGAVYLGLSATASMTNCIFSGNVAAARGGGLFVAASGRPTLTNCTFSGNRAGYGGAIMNDLDYFNNPPAFTNCIIWGNGATEVGNNPGLPNYIHTLVKGLNTGDFTGTEDPLFISQPDANTAPTTAGDLRLQAGSPAINAGTNGGAPATDIEGTNRPLTVSDPADVGAYEFVSKGPTASVLSVNGSSEICSGNTANLVIAITSGTSPYTVVYSDGTNQITVENYISGADIIVTPAETTTYSMVSVTDADSHAGTGSSGTPTITVNPTPNAVATPASQTICSGSPITAIALTGNVTGTTYNWIRDNTVAVTGIAVSGSGDINGILTNTTNSPVSVTFTITPSANSCDGAPITATVLVNPIPNATATPASQTICSGLPITTIAFKSDVSGTAYNWTRDNTAAVTGIAASGSGDFGGALTNTTNAPVTVTFTITPSANSCSGAPVTATVLVKPGSQCNSYTCFANYLFGFTH